MPEDITTPSPLFKNVSTKGRPKKILTDEGLRAIENLAKIQCTDEEIAAVIGLSVDVLTNSNNGASFAEAKKRGQNSGKASLRRMQYEAAEKGNATILVWLGKQYLGQTDKQETITHGSQDLVFNIIPATPEDAQEAE